MKLAQLTEASNDFQAHLEKLANTKHNFALLGKPGTGKIYTIKSLIPDVKTIEVHSHMPALDLVKALAKADGQTVLIDLNDKLSPEIVNIIKAALEGSVSYKNASEDVGTKIGRVIISSSRELPPSILTRLHTIRTSNDRLKQGD